MTVLACVLSCHLINENDDDDDDEYSRCCNNLVSFYQEDLSIDIVGEVQQFQIYIHSKYEGKKTDFTHAEFYDIIVQDQIRSVFPNHFLTLHIAKDTR